MSSIVIRAPSIIMEVVVLLLLQFAAVLQCGAGFTTPSASKCIQSYSKPKSNRQIFAQDEKGTLFFAEETATSTSDDNEAKSMTNTQLFDSSTLAEANDALRSVGWAGVAPMQGDGEMTSEDPFVKQIDESIRGEMGVGLDELLNPAKV